MIKKNGDYWLGYNPNQVVSLSLHNAPETLCTTNLHNDVGVIKTNSVTYA